MSNVVAFRGPSAEEKVTDQRPGTERLLAPLREFLKDAPMSSGLKNAEELSHFERALRERVRQVEREVMQRALEASDIDGDAVEIEGTLHRRVLRSSQTYMTEAGAVVVKRWLYKDRSNPGSRAVPALDARLGMVEGFWTPNAAEQGAWVVTHMTPKKAEELFGRMGGMQPSKSSLDRLPKALSSRWESCREHHEQTLRDAIVVPDGTRSVMVSLDGVMGPVEGGKSPAEVRAKAAEEGRVAQGPGGYRELGCAVLAFCDDKGDLLSAIRFGRAPEKKKRSLKDTLRKDLAHVLSKHPDLTVVKVADAGGDNWQFFAALPEGPEILDFFHASEHLSAAVAAAYGNGTKKSRRKYEELRTRLLEDIGGVDSVLNALAYLKRTHPRVRRIARELAYFRKNRKRMRYAEWKGAGYMIGSGVVEAACKTLVAQRLKLSGMRWSPAGAQAILTMRGWDQSERFDRAWALLSATYQRNVHLIANVLAFSPNSNSRQSSAPRGASG